MFLSSHLELSTAGIDGSWQPRKPCLWPERRRPSKLPSQHISSLARYTVKFFPIFPSPAGMSLTKLYLNCNNLIITVQREFAKWHRGWGREIRKPFLQCTLPLLGWAGRRQNQFSTAFDLFGLCLKTLKERKMLLVQIKGGKYIKMFLIRLQL